MNAARLTRAVLRALVIILLCASQSSAKRKLCGAALQSHLVRVCTFAYERTPCFSSRFPKSNSVRSTGARAFTGIANQCCEEGCTVLDMRATCCFKLSCLKRCYPNSGYGRRINGEEAVKII
ncbi:hypothetical protein Tcan_11830 [Toxocara canis]|uniref:Insulin-like domain-containing protein n=1 Tax=Toxocara canis TaxID=6265 RepID=A0A0B2W454_TOXCA|nr:hypothetical protein Tcan_11830 [Toxocara canis]